ncbi:MAG: GNAT family N-acetyltransferase [Alphaproteobacteria bacterium]|nr:GNAT family N-acetyltransferase [Alphaproteobacteria bacterium]
MRNGLEIRRARGGDESLVAALLRELAEYERLTDKFFLTEERIRSDFFEAHAVSCDIGFANAEPVGLATWYWTYSSFRAVRGIYLEDLYIRPQFRGRKFGKALLAHLAKTALDGNGGYVGWSVLDWNRNSIAFYDSLGAEPVRGWTDYRLEGAAFAALAR